MNELKCEIIRDLIPSYVDKICSKESKEIIEIHLLKCKNCSEFVEKMETYEIISDKIEEKEIDYMKAIKRHIINKHLLNFGLLMSFIVLGLIIIINNYGDVPITLYYIILPILMLGSYIMLSDYTTKTIMTKWKVGIGVLGVCLICYSIILGFLILKWINSGIYPFGIQSNKVGPFVYCQFLMISAIHIIIFITTIIISFKTKNSYNILLDVNITGCCLSFSFISILKRIDTIESFILARNMIIIIFTLESIFIAIILIFLDKKNRLSHIEN